MFDKKKAYEIGLEVMDGNHVGRDPRRMKQVELEQCGHEAMPLTRVIRAKCIDCCAGVADEVRKCVAVTCPNWPYRMGRNPMRVKRVMSAEQRQAAVARLAAARVKL